MGRDLGRGHAVGEGVRDRRLESLLHEHSGADHGRDQHAHDQQRQPCLAPARDRRGDIIRDCRRRPARRTRLAHFFAAASAIA